MSEVLARLDEPISRSCEDVLPVAFNVIRETSSKGLADPQVHSLKGGGFEIAGEWSRPSSDPAFGPHGFRRLAALMPVSKSSCRIKATMETKDISGGRSRALPTSDTELLILKRFDAAKASDIARTLSHYRM